MQRLVLISLALLFLIIGSTREVLADESSPRERIRLDDSWKFFLGDPPEAASQKFDDASWRTVTLPHDWSIEFAPEPKGATGRGGGYFPAGIGWYRQIIEAPGSWQGKKVEVEFEGVYMDSEIFLNGHKLDEHPYGYTTFFVDLTPELKIGSRNLLAVRVNNPIAHNTRWYSGSGIYRHVWLQVTDPVHVKNWGVFVKTDEASDQAAKLTIETTLSNQSTASKDLRIESEILGPKKESLGKLSLNATVPAGSDQPSHQSLTIPTPPLWSPENPQLCQVATQIFSAGTLVDSVVTKFGIRHLAWSAKEGFTINGKMVKMKGGCIHADNGVLGACAFDRAEVRKVEILKSTGFNAIRTAHNPYSPTFLDTCDRLGIMVMENSFDCWSEGKNPADYHLYFKDWWQRDLDAMLLRDRNHPSIVIWDLGNETPGIFDKPEVAAYAPKLAEEVHRLDGTRPETIASNSWPKPPEMALADVSWNAEDIIGSNYQISKQVKRHLDHPDQVLISTESGCPVGEARAVLTNSFVVGDFEWTAQDYLGESGLGSWYYSKDNQKPFYHGATSGSVDLIGNLKPVYRYWNVRWQTGIKLGMAVEQPEGDSKIKLAGWSWFPTWDSWTWPGLEGKPMKVEVYSAYPKIRLYLNDSLVEERPTGASQKEIFSLNYHPGVLKAVGLNGDHESETVQLKTVGQAISIKLSADRTELAADGQDLSFIKVEVVDKEGQLQPSADQMIHFDLTGTGTIAGLGNADMTSQEPYQGVQCHVYQGRALVVLRSSREAGSIDLKASADGLTPAEVLVKTNH